MNVLWRYLYIPYNHRVPKHYVFLPVDEKINIINVLFKIKGFNSSEDRNIIRYLKFLLHVYNFCCFFSKLNEGILMKESPIICSNFEMTHVCLHKILLRLLKQSYINEDVFVEFLKPKLLSRDWVPQIHHIQSRYQREFSYKGEFYFSLMFLICINFL